MIHHVFYYGLDCLPEDSEEYKVEATDNTQILTVSSLTAAKLPYRDYSVKGRMEHSPELVVDIQKAAANLVNTLWEAYMVGLCTSVLCVNAYVSFFYDVPCDEVDVAHLTLMKRKMNRKSFHQMGCDILPLFDDYIGNYEELSVVKVDGVFHEDVDVELHVPPWTGTRGPQFLGELANRVLLQIPVFCLMLVPNMNS